MDANELRAAGAAEGAISGAARNRTYPGARRGHARRGSHRLPSALLGRRDRRWPASGTGDAPQHRPEKYRKHNHERGDRDRRSRYARLDIAADDELDDVEADEHHDRPRERLVLRVRR